MDSPPVRTVTTAETDKAVDALVLAFSADPTVRWIYPDPHQFLAAWPAMIRAFGGKTIEHGSAYAVNGFAGVGLWLPPDIEPDEEELNAVIESTVSETIIEDVGTVFEQMDAYHPQDGPCWYLPLIGVDPAHQGKGLGTALMQHALAVCDRDGLPAYLESSNPANISLYERHGFDVLGKIQVGSSPPIHPMLRQPR